jgi:tetratricopeptide (TPR) repeat protein
VKTDSEGLYRFKAAPGSTYTLRAEMSGQSETTFGPFVLSPDGAKTVDLTLVPIERPAFFDQPSFIVAGVTDSSNRGGHGSDTILRSSEALTRDAASLSKAPGNTATPSAESLREALEREPNNAGLHHALADAEERRGSALDAVREYQRAAEMDATERNVFDWGSELMLHRASEPAIEVFTKGSRLYPRSVRMLLGLAVALYARGLYDQSAQRFFEATDLNPDDPSPYLFLSKVQSSAITGTDGFVERLGRIARLHPEIAWADYAYAASLWKQGNGALGTTAVARVRSLLEKAIRLDPKLAAAHLQLGIVCAAQNDFPQAITAYQEAVKIDPGLEEAHYRLAQAYVRAGDGMRAQKEFELHGRLAKESEERFERERHEIQQFVIELRGRASQPQ